MLKKSGSTMRRLCRRLQMRVYTKNQSESKSARPMERTWLFFVNFLFIGGE